MPSQVTTNTNELDLIFFKITHDALLQLSTGPMLIGLLGAKAYAQTMVALGEASEEVFRGDRLPVLQFPVPVKSE